MNRSEKLPHRSRQVPTVDSDLDSPTPRSKSPGGNFDDDAASNYESSAEDKPVTPAAHTLLTEDPFSTEISKILFESIDQLRKNGAQDLDLPQLVIVGKQSAGKSSLLQSLTDIPFPVGSRLCTRFATRIVSKRSRPGDSDLVIASIEPGEVDPFNYREDDITTDNFSRKVPSLSAEEFESIVQDATEAMGINSPLGSRNRNFSSKVLKIELAGPKRSHFAILDVPGVFSSTTGSVTDEEMNGVTKMVVSYMKKPGNIIILVGDATDDLATQAIFKHAETLDVDSSRIVAVFTKCDRAQVPENIVQTVKEGDGIAGKFLRWHVVRNRDPKASSSFNRELEETTLFSHEPWLEIPEQQRGTATLKSYLGNLLCKRIREGFPELQRTVEDKLQEQEARLEKLGEPRENYYQQSAYLRDIVKTYEDLARKALTSPTELPLDEIKLRGFTRSMEADFAKMMAKDGHRYQFLDIGQEIESDRPREESDSDSDSRTIAVPLPVTDFPTRNSNPARRRRLTPAPTPSPAHRASRHLPYERTVNPLYLEIQRQIKANRGEELPGMLNPAVLKPLWVKQTSKWLSLGEDHLKDIVAKTTDVAIKIFWTVTQDIDITERTKHKLEQVISDFAAKERKRVLSQLHELCHKNATQALHTNNSQFEQSVNEARSKRFKGALERYRKANPPTLFLRHLVNQDNGTFAAGPELYDRWAIVDDDYVTKLFNEIHPYGEREQNTQEEIHDLLKAYYDIALQNFLHDVHFSIVEPFLISKNGPLLGLSTDYILSLTDAEVEDYGGEDQSVVQNRKDALEKIERLRKATEIASSAWRKTRPKSKDVSGLLG